MELEERSIDAQGRISLPIDWRRDVLQGADRVVVIRKGEELVIKPKKTRKPSDFFNSITVDIKSDLSDWQAVKNELLNPKEE